MAGCINEDQQQQQEDQSAEVKEYHPTPQNTPEDKQRQQEDKTTEEAHHATLVEVIPEADDGDAVISEETISLDCVSLYQISRKRRKRFKDAMTKITLKRVDGNNWASSS